MITYRAPVGADNNNQSSSSSWSWRWRCSSGGGLALFWKRRRHQCSFVAPGLTNRKRAQKLSFDVSTKQKLSHLQTRSIFFLSTSILQFSDFASWCGARLGCLMHLTQKLGEIAAAAEKMRDCGDNSAIGASPPQDFGQSISSLGFEDGILTTQDKCYIFLAALAAPYLALVDSDCHFRNWIQRVTFETWDNVWQKLKTKR